MPRAVPLVPLAVLLLGASASPNPAISPLLPAVRRNGPVAPPRPSKPLVQCTSSPLPAGEIPYPVGETLTYDLDVTGVRAGKLQLKYTRPDEHTVEITALAESNTFFENVRKLKAKATSLVDGTSLRPWRYREDAVEDGVKKWTEVLFKPGHDEADIHFAIGDRGERHRRYPMLTGPHDLLSIVYYLRTLDLKIGDEFCLDIYANRRVWRLSGSVAGEEWISTPAGKFKTWRLSGKAQRTDRPASSREIHVWISQEPDRIPVAALGEIDLGAARVLLTRVKGRSRAPDYTGGEW